MIEQIQWLGHGSFVIQGSPLIYINPWRVTRSLPPADIILISDGLYDHCSPVDVNKVRDAHTQVITSEQVAANLIEGATVLRPWQSVTRDRVCIKGIPAYDPAQNSAHSDGLGFSLSMYFYDIYYAGTTRPIPEMDHLHPDIAILPIDGGAALTVAEAVQVTQQLCPRWAIPSDWGTSGVGATRLEAQMFAAEVGQAAEVPLLDVVLEF